MNYLNHFNNKVAFVTGGGQGLGRALCLRLAAVGAIVVCTDKNLELANNTVVLINSGSIKNKALSLQLDVTINEQISKVTSQVISKYKGIDFFFTNAGISIGGEIRDLKNAHWANVLSVNLSGLISCATEVYKHMCEIKQGHIINIASASGLLEYTALSTPYAVAKHGVVTFSKALRLEALDFNVKVTTVCPGFIRTEIGANMDFINSKGRMKQKTFDLINKGISSDLAAQKILKGIARNKSILIFPREISVFIFILKIFKFIERIFVLKMIRNFRNTDRFE